MNCRHTQPVTELRTLSRHISAQILQNFHLIWLCSILIGSALVFNFYVVLSVEETTAVYYPDLILLTLTITRQIRIL